MKFPKRLQLLVNIRILWLPKLQSEQPLHCMPSVSIVSKHAFAQIGQFLLKPGSIELADIDAPSSSTDSDRTWHLAQSWFRECENLHTMCSRKSDRPQWQPTRLLNVGTAENPSVHLQVNNSNSNIETYVSLSHCWGKIKILRLLQSNVEALQVRISEIELPKTFREAISVTRRLGYSFLWIDSLCIIQDSAEDWRKEAAIMGDVYRNAVFNIAATKSSNGSQGCFANRNPILIQPCYVEAKWEWEAGRYQLHDSALWRHGVTRAPLNTRAWVVQEMSLAKRVLHFGKDQLFWECDQKMACETFPRGIPLTQIEVTPRINSFFFDGQMGNGQDETLRLRCFSEEWYGILKAEPKLRYYDLWANVVSAYTKCELTQPTDKLIAISGLAQEFKALTGDKYLAGLWRRYLPHHLLWFIENPMPFPTSPAQSKKYCAPSWSWASTVGEVMDHPVTSLPSEQIHVEIVDVQVDTITSDTTGECTGGYLKLRCLLKPLRWKWIEEDELYSLFLEEEQLDFSIAFPDRRDYVTSNVIFCLPVQIFEVYEDEPRLYGLILEMVEQKSNTFRRVGQFKVDYDHCSTIADINLGKKDIIII
jgi:hypothetical protein